MMPLEVNEIYAIFRIGGVIVADYIKGGKGMSKFATNQCGVIKAPKPVVKDPQAAVKTGDDLRVKKTK